MGFFKSVWGGVKGVVSDGIGAVGDLLDGDSGSSTTQSNFDKAWQQLYTELYNKYFAEFVAQGQPKYKANNYAGGKAVVFLNSAEGKAMLAKLEATLNQGSNVKSQTFGDTLKGLLGSVFGGVKTGVENGLGTAIGGGLVKAGESLFGSTKVGGLKEVIANFGAETAGETLVAFLKKYWYIAILPLGILILFAVKLLISIFNPSKGAKRKSTSRTYRR